MTDLYAQAWFVGPDNKDGGRNRDAGGCNNDDTEVSRHKRNRHHCVTADGKKLLGIYGSDGDYLRFDVAGDGHNPCNNLNGAKFIGGGVNGRGEQNDFPGRSSNFGNAHVALKCRLNSYDDGTLRSWYKSGHIDKTGATGTRGDGSGDKKFRTFYEQLLFGMKTDAGTQQSGYCDNVSNLMKDVGGGTCYDKIKSTINAEKAERDAREWCKSNRTNDRCRCVNVADMGSNFVSQCESNPSWAGCDKVNQGMQKYKDAGLMSATGLFGNADCITPGLCDGDVVIPQAGKISACANKVAICDQKIDANNVKAMNLKIEQGCKINFESPPPPPPASTPPPPPASTPPPPPASDSPPPSDSDSPPTSSSIPLSSDVSVAKELKFYEKPKNQIGMIMATLFLILVCFMLLILL